MTEWTTAYERDQGDRERARILDRFDRIADDDAEDGDTE